MYFLETNNKFVTGTEENEKDEVIDEIMIEKAREISKTMNPHQNNLSKSVLTKVRK